MNIKRYKKELLNSLDKDEIIDPSILLYYNTLTTFNTIINNIEKYKKIKDNNVFNKMRADAIINGKTLQHYVQYPEDKEFINIISENIKNFAFILNKKNENKT